MDSDSAKTHLSLKAYSLLNTFFKQHEDEVVEISILSPDIQPANGILVEASLCVGISKKGLALAFIRARELFLLSVKADPPHADSALDASRIILIFDPEFVTAANFRKRRLAHLRDTASQIEFQEALHKETQFLNSILTSPLHRQSKSPTLWYHRTWIGGASSQTQRLTSSIERTLKYAEEELVAVMKAGERHPKNYYAWQYARRLLTACEALCITHESSQDSSQFQTLATTFASRVKEWCRLHPSDISGWSYLIFVLHKMQSVSSSTIIVKEVLENALKLQLEQESLWFFLRTMLAGTYLGSARAAILQEVKDRYERSTTERRCTSGQYVCKDHITRALIWIEQHSCPLPSPPG